MSLTGLAITMIAAASAMGALGPIELPDQRGGRDSIAAHQGHTVLLVVVDARRLGTVRRWEQDLLTRFPRLHVLTIADVNETRPTTVDRVAEVLARRVPPDVAVLIDIERRFARELGLDTEAPNLLLIDRSGVTVEHWRGRYSKPLADSVAQRIASLEEAT